MDPLHDPSRCLAISSHSPIENHNNPKPITTPSWGRSLHKEDFHLSELELGGAGQESARLTWGWPISVAKGAATRARLFIAEELQLIVDAERGPGFASVVYSLVLRW